MVEDLRTQRKIRICQAELAQPPGEEAILRLLSDQSPALLQLGLQHMLCHSQISTWVSLIAFMYAYVCAQVMV